MEVQPRQELSSSSSAALYEEDDIIARALSSEGELLEPNKEVEIVFSQLHPPQQQQAQQEEDANSTASSSTVSSEVVLTGDPNFWDAMAKEELALTEYDSSLEAAYEFLSRSSSSSEEDSSDSDSDEPEEVNNEWTDLTKYPEVTELEVKEVKEAPPKSSILSEKLWDRDYETVEERILSHPQEVSALVDMPLSKELQAYPLHLACAMRPLPPLSVFQLLLSVYLQAAQQAESRWGMLPLHFAANLSATMTIEDDPNHLQIVETLLSACPEARSAQELCQGRTPLHLAAASTVQSMDGRVPGHSHAILQALMMDRTETKDVAAGDTAYDIAHYKSKESLVEMELGWKLNPLLQFQQREDPPPKPEVTKKSSAQDEDNNSTTDATSVTGSLSSGSFTSGYTTQYATEEKEETLEGVKEAEEEDESRRDEEAVSVSDDDTFFTARSHEQSTVRMENRNETGSLIDDATLMQMSASVPKSTVDQDEVESVLTDTNSVVPEQAVPEPPTIQEQADAAIVPYIPRAVQVDKVLLHLQVHVSNLVRPRSGKPLVKSLLRSKNSVNPYFEVELLHIPTDVSIHLHQSEPYYQCREALWKPVRFAIDASIAQACGMVLSLNVYHKQIDKQGKPLKADEYIGSHHASPWDLNESVNRIPLKRGNRQTGLVRLVSYQMVPMNRADCWRVYW